MNDAAIDDRIVYPVTDGMPMGESSRHVDCILALYGAFKDYFADQPMVTVTGDMFWYPVRGRVDIVTAPDLMFVFGRPMKDRLSYKQWEEDDIGPQVVIEVLSQSNYSAAEWRLLDFYNRYGVEEYLKYDPLENCLHVSVRREGELSYFGEVEEYSSPRLGVRFTVAESDDLRVYGRDGSLFRGYSELKQQSRANFQLALDERAKAERERIRTEQERQRTEQERMRAEKLAAKLRSLGIDPDE